MNNCKSRNENINNLVPSSRVTSTFHFRLTEYACVAHKEQYILLFQKRFFSLFFEKEKKWSIDISTRCHSNNKTCAIFGHRHRKHCRSRTKRYDGKIREGLEQFGLYAASHGKSSSKSKNDSERRSVQRKLCLITVSRVVFIFFFSRSSQGNAKINNTTKINVTPSRVGGFKFRSFFF